jgi:hypothetical protein
VSANTKATRAKAEEKIIELAKKGSVMIFGYQVTEALKSRLELKTYCIHLDTDLKVGLFVKTATGNTRGVLSLSDDYIIGVDIRFAIEATVVIVRENMPDRETIAQMSARGVRTIGEIVSHLFIVG